MPTLYRIFGNLHFIPMVATLGCGNLHFIPRGDGGGDGEYLSPPPAI